MNFVSSLDLVNAQYSFERVFKHAVSSLKPGGIFVGQLFGNRDEWASNERMTFHALDEAEGLFSGMEILSFREEERDKPTAAGEMKHWHIFHFIVRR